MYSPTKLHGPAKKSVDEKMTDISKSRLSKYEKMRVNSSALSTTRKEQEMKNISQASHSIFPQQEGRSLNR